MGDVADNKLAVRILYYKIQDLYFCYFLNVKRKVQQTLVSVKYDNLINLSLYYFEFRLWYISSNVENLNFVSRVPNMQTYEHTQLRQLFYPASNQLAAEVRDFINRFDCRFDHITKWAVKE